MTSVYLDNAASTRPDPEVLDVMATLGRDHFANPSAAHAAGAAAARVMEEARQQIASVLGCASPAELTFTSGGTEANALAMLGAAARARGRHVIVSGIEHPAVLKNAERLAREDQFELTIVPPDRSGTMTVDAVLAAVRPDTSLVAVMLVNNELGTIQPVTEIARALRSRTTRASAPHGGSYGPGGPHLHVDAVQALGLLSFRASSLGADSLALSGHKIHGPRGSGALWLRPGARLRPLWEGGGQEHGRRSGSENLPAIAGFARAVTLAAQARLSGATIRMAELRDQLEAGVVSMVPGAFATVTARSRAPHISSLSFPGLPAEPLLHALEARGVMASAGSACASRVRGPSHVLKAIGVADDTAVLRFSLSRETTAEQIELAIQAVGDAVIELDPWRQGARLAMKRGP